MLTYPMRRRCNRVVVVVVVVVRVTVNLVYLVDLVCSF